MKRQRDMPHSYDRHSVVSLEEGMAAIRCDPHVKGYRTLLNGVPVKLYSFDHFRFDWLGDQACNRFPIRVL